MHRLGEHLVQVPLGWFSKANRGAFTRLVTEGTAILMSIPGMIIAQLVTVTVTPATVAIAVLFVDWRLSLAMVVFVPLGIRAYRNVQRAVVPDTRRSARANPSWHRASSNMHRRSKFYVRPVRVAKAGLAPAASTAARSSTSVASGAPGGGSRSVPLNRCGCCDGQATRPPPGRRVQRHEVDAVHLDDPGVRARGTAAGPTAIVHLPGPVAPASTVKPARLERERGVAEHRARDPR